MLQVIMAEPARRGGVCIKQERTSFPELRSRLNLGNVGLL